jgi:hypothetical protein
MIDKLKSRTAPCGDRPSLAKEKVAAWKKRTKIRNGNNRIRSKNHINGIMDTYFPFTSTDLGTATAYTAIPVVVLLAAASSLRFPAITLFLCAYFGRGRLCSLPACRPVLTPGMLHAGPPPGRAKIQVKTLKSRRQTVIRKR